MAPARSTDSSALDRSRQPFARIAGVAVALALLLVASSLREAQAQVAPPPCVRACSAPPPDPPAVSTGNIPLSAGYNLLNLGSDFLWRNVGKYGDGSNPTNNPEGSGADAPVTPAQRFRAWTEAYGQAARTFTINSYPGDKRTTYGTVAGISATVAPGANLGVAVDQSWSKVGIQLFPQSARINLTQVGLNGSYQFGNWIAAFTAIRGFANVSSSRDDVGSIDTAAYGAKLWGALGELNYIIWNQNNWRFVPKVGFDWQIVKVDSFSESGGPNAVTAGSLTAERWRVFGGGEIGHSWLYDKKVFDLATYARLVHIVWQDVGSLAVTSNTGFSTVVAGIRESRLGLDTGGTFSMRLNSAVRLYAIYDGRFRESFVSHTGTLGVELKW
jgi:uncharacterized protein with beta-barrel porin domain